MAKKRVTRKQLLKEPDEFITTTGKLIAWAKDNLQAIVIGAVGFFMLIIGISIYGYIQQNRSDAAQVMFSQAVTKYQTEAEKKSEGEALTAVSADFDKLIESYGNQPAGQLGRVFYGHICLAGKAYDQAISHYEKAMANVDGDTSLTNIVLNGLATAYQQKGEYSHAIEKFRMIADGTDLMLKDAALFNLGKLYEQIGKFEESKKAYQQLRDDFPTSMYSSIAREKVAG
jgi:tetratricopeptide (TPR) repeat protein